MLMIVFCFRLSTSKFADARQVCFVQKKREDFEIEMYSMPKIRLSDSSKYKNPVLGSRTSTVVEDTQSGTGRASGCCQKTRISCENNHQNQV